MIWTKEVAIFTRDNEDYVIDSIPLAEVIQITLQDVWHAKSTGAPKPDAELAQSITTNMTLMKSVALVGTKLKLNRVSNEIHNESDVGAETRASDSENLANLNGAGAELAEAQVKDQTTGKSSSAVLQIQTTHLGFNSGRTYYIRIPSAEQCQDVLDALTKAAKAARTAYEAKSSLRKSQDMMRSIYNSRPFQYAAAVLIFAVRAGPAVTRTASAPRPRASARAPLTLPFARSPRPLTYAAVELNRVLASTHEFARMHPPMHLRNRQKLSPRPPPYPAPNLCPGRISSSTPPRRSSTTASSAPTAPRPRPATCSPAPTSP